MTEDMVYLAVDQSKIQRANDTVRAVSKEKGEALTRADVVRCIMFNSQIDHT